MNGADHPWLTALFMKKVMPSGEGAGPRPQTPCVEIMILSLSHNIKKRCTQNAQHSAE
jgi:hypothetical protein